MNLKNIKYLLLIAILSVGAFSVWNITGQLELDEKPLVAYKVTGDIVLDGYNTEKIWENSTKTILENYDDSGYDVTLSFAHNGNDLFFYAEWTDQDKDDKRKGWQWDDVDSTYDNLAGNEDRITFVWPIGGAAIQCGHNPSTSDTMLFDVWHWKASRTGSGGWADDKYWDGAGRQSDAKTAGGYKDNSVVAQATDAAEITSKLGNSTAVTIFGVGDLPYWTTNGIVINWTSGATADTLEDFISGYYTTIPVGSRGDVLTAANHDNTTSWRLEGKRALDTTNSDDILFEEGSEYGFYLAIHDNSGEASHFVEPTTLITLSISSDPYPVPVTTTIVNVTTATVFSTIPTTETTTEEAGMSFLMMNSIILGSMIVAIFTLRRKR